MSMHSPGPKNVEAKPKDFSATLKRVLYMLRPEAWRLILVLVFAVISVAASAFAPMILGKATDIVFTGQLGRAATEGTQESEQIARNAGAKPGVGVDFPHLAQMLILALGIYFCAALFMYLQGRVMRLVVQNTGWHLRRRASRQVNRVSLSYMDQQKRGDLLSRVTNDVDNLTQVMQQSLTQAFNAVISVIGILAMMFYISWKLALITLAVIPIGIIGAAIVAMRAQPHFKNQWKATGEVSGVVEEAFTGAQVATVYNLAPSFASRFAKNNENLRVSAFKAQFVSMLMMPIMFVVENIGYVVVAVSGGLMVTGGAMSVGMVQAFLQYSQNLNQPVSQLAQIATLTQSGLASAERILEFLDAPQTEGLEISQRPERPESPVRLAKTVHGHIAFENLSFGYDPNKPVIRDLSLSVEPGQSVAIVGPTGAGKTTLVNLLMRFYEPQSGRITLDGIDISELPRDQVRAQMGMVLQDTWLLEGTIEENIAFGRLGASRQQVEAAARATSVERIIRTLPKGYDTLIDDSGEGISNGEKQLLTIARAFIADPPVLILDEATSSVDTRTEMLVSKAMGRLRAGRTAFVIAHRLSTIRDADLIVVMKDGQVVQMGKHEELLLKPGVYADLYNSQFTQS